MTARRRAMSWFLVLLGLLPAACAEGGRAPVGDRAWFVYLRQGPPESRLRVDLEAGEGGFSLSVDGVPRGTLAPDLGARGGDPEGGPPLPLWLRPEWRRPGTATPRGSVTDRQDFQGRQVLVLEGPAVRQYYHPLTGFLVGWERAGAVFRLENSSATGF